MSFKEFFESQTSEEERNIKETLRRIPAAHRRLIASYRYELETGNTLDHDNQHVGQIDDKKKIITLAAPWLHSRELTFLHEVAHKVWTAILTEEQKKSWRELLKKHPYPDRKESTEEAWCMAYASTYAKHPPAIYLCDDWQRFVKRV
jgi:hypothetical protein